MLLEWPPFILFFPRQCFEIIVSVRCAILMRAIQELPALESRGRRRIFVYFLWIHLMISLKVLDKMIPPSKSMLATVALAEGTLIFGTLLDETLEMAGENVGPSKLDSTRTCVGAVFLFPSMSYHFGFVLEGLITFSACNDRIIPYRNMSLCMRQDSVSTECFALVEAAVAA